MIDVIKLKDVIDDALFMVSRDTENREATLAYIVKHIYIIISVNANSEKNTEVAIPTSRISSGVDTRENIDRLNVTFFCVYV